MLTNEQLATMSDEEYIKAAKEEFKDLPRAQRRQKERELKVHVKTMNQFTPKQLALIEEVIRYGVNERINDKLEMIGLISNMATSSYLIENNEDITLDEVAEIQETITAEFAISYEKYSKIINSCKGDINMAKKKFEKYESDVKKEAIKLINNGVKQGQAIIILQDKFPMLSKAMLVNAFKKVKAEIEEVKEDPEIIAAAEYIFPEIKEEEKEDKQEPQKQATEEIEEKSNAITPVEEEKPVQAKSKLKRIEVREVFQGEFGEYIKTLEGVTVSDKLYKDVESVDKESKDIIEKNVALIDSFKASIEELNNKIDECNLTMSNVKAMAGEIKEVMAMA